MKENQSSKSGAPILNVASRCQVSYRIPIMSLDMGERALYDQP